MGLLSHVLLFLISALTSRVFLVPGGIGNLEDPENIDSYVHFYVFHLLVSPELW